MNKILISSILAVILLSTSITLSFANTEAGKKPIASFVDPKKDPQSYVKRYQNEPKYKEWFDKNYGLKYKSIYEAVDLPEPTKTKTLTNKELDDKKVADAKKAEKIKLAKERATARKLASQVKIDSTPTIFIPTWNVYVQDIPEWAHSSMTMNVVVDAIKSWEKVNPDLKFRIVDSGERFHNDGRDISIRWVTRITNHIDGVSTEHILGLTKTTTSTSMDGSWASTKNKILIDLADRDCHGTPIFWDAETLTNTITHEFGHVLGMEHSSDPNNLMFDPYLGTDNFDTHGYVVPKKITDVYYVGEKESKNKDCFINIINAYDPYTK